MSVTPLCHLSPLNTSIFPVPGPGSVPYRFTLKAGFLPSSFGPQAPHHYLCRSTRELSKTKHARSLPVAALQGSSFAPSPTPPRAQARTRFLSLGPGCQATLPCSPACWLLSFSDRGGILSFLSFSSRDLHPSRCQSLLRPIHSLMTAPVDLCAKQSLCLWNIPAVILFTHLPGNSLFTGWSPSSLGTAW